MTTTIPELTVVIPCFNEKDNVRPLVRLLDTALAGINWVALFVDDDSPDGTAREVRALARERADVRLLHRVGRRGLAGACIEGILSSISPFIAVMDCDLQHDETKLADMYRILNDRSDVALVIGSRFAEGGSVGSGLSKVRAWGSGICIRLARRFLKVTASDPMSGFFMVRRENFNEVVVGLQTQGFKILADMLAASKGRWAFEEVGFQFRSRNQGESKMDAAVTLEFLSLLLSRLTGGIFPIRFILFGLVGVSGVLVQLLGVWLAHTVGQMPFWVAQAIGVWMAMTTNFTLNNILTYRDRMLRGFLWFRGLFSFYAVCLIGAIANVGIADYTYNAFAVWSGASIAGAIVSALWNYLASALFTWRVR